MSRQILLDTETTGLEAREHRVIEIGCIELRDRKVTAEQRWYLNPERDSDPGALAVHGLTTEFLADKPRFHQIADEVIEFLRGAELLIHNAAFDVGFMDKELERAGRPERIASLCTVTDTVRMAKRLHPGQKASLDALCRRYGIDNSHRELHGALLDARLLAEVYLAMTGGQAALGLISEPTGGRRDPTAAETAAAFTTDLSRPLRVIRASDEELVAHVERLQYIVKKSGKRLWDGELAQASLPSG
ncbi:DNA polymerase III subunit epsilon [Nevskia ramosa]|uniref:DNA polymerase III subunit epsilon n=1 Tax=Nevskia ramosa TaxID=64002 RepID=UPI0003B554C5|nr:DNA polymerase III subunit epsilon [Nevskia ramosa]